MIPPTMTASEGSLRSSAEKTGQSQVFDFWGELNDAEQKQLLASLAKIDFEKVKPNFDSVMGESTPPKNEPLPQDSCAYLMNTSEAQAKEWFDLGIKEMSKGKVAVLLLAGGQGTRLGSADPKGMYDVGLPSGKTLFQIQSERILRLQNLSGNTIPFYIMTSEATHEKTRNYFESNKFFGLSGDNVTFFNQNTLPCLSLEGKIMLATKSKAAEAPDGNGGLYRGLVTSGALDDMKKRGIEHIHAYCVDNVLVRVADPTFIGYCVASKVESGVKVVPKNAPGEQVGVVCKRDGKYGVCEYSEISEEDSKALGADGKLLYDAANICNHYFSVAFLAKVCLECQLPFHIARKKIPTVDKAGNPIKPTANNGIKLEMFIFDVLQFCTNLGVFYVDRHTDFSPLKNASGAADSTPQHCRQDMLELCKKMVEKAGGVVGPGSEVEVSPLTSYQGEGLDCTGTTYEGVVQL